MRPGLVCHSHTFPPDWPHKQDGHITEKRTGQHEWDYAVASRSIYDTLRDRADSDDSNDDHLNTISTAEDIRDRIGGRETERRGGNMASITAWHSHREKRIWSCFDLL